MRRFVLVALALSMCAEPAHAEPVPLPCPQWEPGDSLPLLLPGGCPAPATGMWRTVQADAALSEAPGALRACAAANEKCAAALRAVPEPPSRVLYLTLGTVLGAGAAWLITRGP